MENLEKNIEENSNQIINKSGESNYNKSNTQEDAGYIYKEKTESSFWDFKSKKIYQNFFDKLKDFLFGIFCFSLMTIFFSYGYLFMLQYSILIGLFLEITMLPFEIFVGIYFFNKRRFISYGGIFLFILSVINFFGLVFYNLVRYGSII